MPAIYIVLFIVAILPIVLSLLGGFYRVSQLGKFDNNYPRKQQAALTGAGARVVAAQKNAWEALAFFTAVVFIASSAKLDMNILALPAYIFLAARILHAIFYIANKALLRSLAFAVAWFDCVYIFSLAVASY